MLRPAPVMGLTATATPLVQRDIVKQLGLRTGSKQLIHGFRRHNLAIEVIECPPHERVERARSWLTQKGRVPAIVYAPTRKVCEQAAEELGQTLRAAPYHAGLGNEARAQTQAAFLEGRLDVVVATIAFGMGVDKANVRTVVHLALPGSVEAYYQEIGRAGRDGLPSRAVLMHHFVDRKTHEFFLERDYPEPAVLKKLTRALDDTPQEAEAVRRRTRISMDDFEKALEKLWIHGGVKGVPEDQLTKGHDAWEAPYAAQRRLREEQLALVARFAESHSCRMVSLVRHFGDQADAGTPCGHCDVCAPAQCIGAKFEAPTAQELSTLSELVARLQSLDGQSSGRLCREILGEEPEHRPRWERLVSGMVRSGQLRVEEDVFEKDGKRIPFSRLYLTARRALGEVRLPAASAPAKPRRGQAQKRVRRGSKRREGRKPAVELPETGASAALVERLRSWRLQEAKKRRVPAFRVLTNRALVAVAQARPAQLRDLEGLEGLGPKVIKDSGAQLISLCK
jgi:DNA topoisomerase-3